MMVNPTFDTLSVLFCGAYDVDNTKGKGLNPPPPPTPMSIVCKRDTHKKAGIWKENP